MRKNSNKNYTLYWIVAISAVLTIPIAAIIVSRVQAGDVAKTVMIMGIFLVLLISITILYKYTFGVTVHEITQEDKVTELDRLNYLLADYHKKYTNPQIRRCIDLVNEQILRFKRRKNVMFQVADVELNSKDSGAIGELVQTVEDAIVINIERLVNRLEIFDDEGIADVIRQNIGYIEEQVHKNNEILMEFESLITETSRMGEVKAEKDISKLRDVVNAMQSLRVDHEDVIDELTKKYNNGRE
ncbi:MAG: hypothetical protein K0S01_2509 [Herbinix sp.]|jgi:hypothetical protein|nr:hypothetical protein [Herbinix sp.]